MTWTKKPVDLANMNEDEQELDPNWGETNWVQWAETWGETSWAKVPPPY